MLARLARLAAVAVVGSGLAVTGLPVGAAHAATGTQNPPALWYKIAGEITDADAVAAASRYRVVILQSWQLAAATRIKSLNPSVTVLAYKDLSAADDKLAALDNERNGRPMATGVGYLEAERNGWFALDTAGARVNWDGYPNLWQLEVWNPAYQQAWVDHVVGEIAAGPFDGVFGDDALTTLRYYSDKTLAGAPTDAAIQAAEGALITRAADALHAIGRKLVVNISGATDNLPIWNAWTTIADGGMLEHFAHWGSDPNSPSNYLWDWGSSGWRAGVNALGSAPLNVAVTTSADTDDRSYRYGLASFLVATGGNGAYTAVDSYKKAPYRTEQSWDLGLATADRQQVGAAYTRAFPRGFAAVNPSKDKTVTLSVPAGMVDVSGAPVTSLTLPPLTGAVLKASTTTSGTTTGKKKVWRHYTVPARHAATAPSRRPAGLPKPVAVRVPAPAAKVVAPLVAPAAPTAATAALSGTAPARSPEAPVARVLGALTLATSVDPRRAGTVPYEPAAALLALIAAAGLRRRAVRRRPI